MASFKTHSTFGLGLGIVFVFSCFLVSLIFDKEFAFFLFLAFVVGSIAPDMDSDSGIPFHITFGVLSLVFGFFVGGFLFSVEELSVWKSIGSGVAGSIFFWGIIGGIFKKFTRHRGMAHSLPGAFLFGSLCLAIAHILHISDLEAFLIFISGLLGYLLHLFLDEIYALVDFQGKKIHIKRSLGTALKLFSSRRYLNVFLYGILIFVFWLYADIFINGSTHLLELFL
jgi:hypothetical protein